MSKGKIIVASFMVFLVLIFIGIAVYFLVIKSNFAEPSSQQRTAAILQVAGLTSGANTDEQKLATLYASRIIARQVNLDTGDLLPATAPHAAQKACVNLVPGQDPAQIRQRCSLAEIYFVQNNEHEIQQIILPISGKGAKSMMHAFLALETDGRTVKKLLYYEQNETPLLGAKVENPGWLQQWSGKKVLNDKAQPSLRVVQQRQGTPDDYTVDGISGATMTSTGVENSINFWVGERGYGPFLQRIREDKKLLPH